MSGRCGLSRLAVEGKLQHAHSRQLELVAQRLHIVRVISPRSSAMNGSAPNSVCTAVKKLGARAGHPLAGFAPSGSRRNVPGGCERAEMIQTNHVDVREQRAQAIDAPAIARVPAGRPSCRRDCPRAVPVR